MAVAIYINLLVALKAMDLLLIPIQSDDHLHSLFTLQYLAMYMDILYIDIKIAIFCSKFI